MLQSIRFAAWALLPIVAAAAAVPLSGQLRTGDFVAVTELAGPRTAIVLVPTSPTGAVLTLPRFRGDNAAPLAVAFDPINADVLVAVRHPLGTAIYRVGVSRRSITRARLVATVPGEAIELLVGYRGDVLVATRGPTGSGMFMIPRNGGVVRRTLNAGPYAAVLGFGTANPAGFVLLDRVASPPSEPGIAQRDLTTGRSTGRWPYTGYRGAAFTGMVDLPTGAPRQVVAHVDGTLALSTGFGRPVPFPLSPTYGAGATIALRGRGFEIWALGDARHPYLKYYDYSSGTQRWAIRSPALPGNPVDFAIPRPSGYALAFGAGCGAGARTARLYGQSSPIVGNTGFGVALANARPGVFEPFLIGASDQAGMGVGLPWSLPGGCLLRVSPDIVVLQPTDARGFASIRLPIPNQPQFAGALFFAQWVEAGRIPMASTAGLAIHVR